MRCVSWHFLDQCSLSLSRLVHTKRLFCSCLYTHTHTQSYAVRVCVCVTSRWLFRGWYMSVGAAKPNVNGVRKRSSCLSFGTKEDAIFSTPVLRLLAESPAAPPPFCKRNNFFNYFRYLGTTVYTAHFQMNINFAAYVILTSLKFTHNIRCLVSSTRSDWSDLAKRAIKHVLRIPLGAPWVFPSTNVTCRDLRLSGTFYFSSGRHFQLLQNKPKPKSRASSLRERRRDRDTCREGAVQIARNTRGEPSRARVHFLVRLGRFSQRSGGPRPRDRERERGVQ